MSGWSCLYQLLSFPYLSVKKRWKSISQILAFLGTVEHLALCQMKYVTDSRPASSGISSCLGDLLLVELTSCIIDFVVGGTTCSVVSHVVVLVTFRFPPPFQTATGTLGFFSTVWQRSVSRTWWCDFLPDLQWTVFVENVDYNCIKLICKLVSCSSWFLEQLWLSDFFLKLLYIQLLNVAEAVCKDLTWWATFDRKQPRDQVMVGYFVNRQSCWLLPAGVGMLCN